MEIATEIRERCACSRHHGLKRLAINIAIKQRCLQRRSPTTSLPHYNDFALDTVERCCQGYRNTFPAAKLRLVGSSAQIAVGLEGQGTYHAHWQFLYATIYLQRHV